MTAPADQPPAEADREAMLGAMAEVMERQAKVTRAEAALSVAQRRLEEATARCSQLALAQGAAPALSPLVAATLQLAAEQPPAPEDRGTLRDRIVAAMEAGPGEVFTPASLAPVVGHTNRDSIRNTLLVLAAKGKIEKVGAGQYRARKGDDEQ